MDDERVTIAGYPLLRALRRDVEREAWVAADASGSGVEVHRSLAGGEGVLAREAEALLRADHPHLVPIRDVAVDGGTVLVRSLLQRDLADWLLHRQVPAPGEVVTALAPIASALGALHEIGAIAGGCAARDVRLDADGAPLLMGEGAQIETDRVTEAWREGSDGVAADAAGWQQLAVTLLEAGGASMPETVEAALERRDLAGAGAALLAAWPALPLELDAAAPVVRAAATERMRQRERAVGADAIWARLALLAERLVDRGGPFAQRGVAALSAVRPRFWAIAGGGAVALCAMAVLLSQTGAADAGAAAADLPSTIVDVAEPTEAVSTEAASTEAVSTEAASTEAASTEPEAAPPSPEPAAGGDPVAAVAALLSEREACLEAGDAGCLVALHDPQSPQLSAEEPWRMPEDGTLEVVQRSGDAWLLRVLSDSEPASVLAMSTEAGWTLRDAWSD